MRKEAELEVQKMVEEARRERDTMKEEVITLKTQKQSLISRLRHVLNSQLELMDVLEIDDDDRSKLKDRTRKVFSAAGSESRPAPVVLQKESMPKPPAVPVKKTEENTNINKPLETGVKTQKKEDGTNLFRDVFGDDMETYIK
jgi:cell division septum initiation protein DivIVA